LPLPVPLAPLVTVIHAALLEAVHGHTDASVTATVPVAPAAATLADVGAIVAVQLTAACVTVNVSSSTVIVPVRLLRLAFAATLNATVPGPLPVAPDVIEIQDAEELDDHWHPASVSTLRLLVVAPAGTEVLTGEIEYAHVCPFCVTVKVRPPAVIVAVRDEVPGFAAAL
jgi:hypothetical protein